MGFFDFLKSMVNSGAIKKDSCPAAKRVVQNANALQTDLVIMDAHGAACPECAKYQGRVFSLSGKSKVFPRIPDVFYDHGAIHEGCGHNFHPYIHGINDPDLQYTLLVHPLSDPRYAKDIIAFSNRPFIDDRTDAAKQKYRDSLDHKKTGETNKYWEEYWAQEAVKKERDAKDYEWLHASFPDKCPKSLTGYRRMKTQNTKNFQVLKQLASEHGRDI